MAIVSRFSSPVTGSSIGRTIVAAPTTSAVLIAVQNRNRRSITIWNNGSQVVYLGMTSAVTSATGIPLVNDPSAPLVDEDTTSAWYAATASGTGDVRALEVA